MPARSVSTSRSPAVGASSPATSRSSVVFPEPFGPVTTTKSPEATSRSTPRRTRFAPKRFSRPRARITRLSVRAYAASVVDHRKLERLVDEDAIDELFRLVTWDEAAQAWHRHSLWRRAVAAKDVDIAEHPDWWAKELWHSTMLWDTCEMGRSGLLALVVQAPD